MVGPNIWRLPAAEANTDARTAVRLAPVMLLLALAVLGLSFVVARAGVARPNLHVFALTVRRPRHDDFVLPAVSIGGLLIQLITQIGVFPLVKVAPPTLLYRPELAPSGDLLITTAATAGVLIVLAGVLWRGRIGWRAPRGQQAELDQELSA